MSRPFAAAERVLLVDNRRRRHLVVLESGGQFHTHAGIIQHDDIIGHPDGSTVRTSRGARLTSSPGEPDEHEYDDADGTEGEEAEGAVRPTA